MTSFFYRNICLETAVRFIHVPYRCQFWFNDADAALKDGRVIYNIYFFIFKMLQSECVCFPSVLNIIVWIGMLFEKNIKWYNSIINNHGFAFLANRLNHITCINMNNNCVFICASVVSTEKKVIIIIFILKYKSFKKWTLEIVQFPLFMFIKKSKCDISVTFILHLFDTKKQWPLNWLAERLRLPI